MVTDPIVLDYATPPMREPLFRRWILDRAKLISACLCVLLVERMVWGIVWIAGRILALAFKSA